MARLARAMLIATFLLASSVSAVRADIQVTLYLHSPANPSVYGQQLIFTVDVGHWCGEGSQPVIYLYDGAAPGPFGWAYLPNWNLPSAGTTSYFHSGTLTVGTHRLWGQAPRCLYQQTTYVDMAITDYFQIVKPAPANAPRANPTAPTAPPRLSAPANLHVGARHSAIGDQPPLMSFVAQRAVAVEPIPGGLVPAALIVVLTVGVLSGLGFARAARQRRHQTLRG